MLVDTNGLVDVLENDPEWADWSIAQLRAQSKVYPLAINPIIYSELSLTFSTVEALEQVLDKMELRTQIGSAPGIMKLVWVASIIATPQTGMPNTRDPSSAT